MQIVGIEKIALAHIQVMLIKYQTGLISEKGGGHTAVGTFPRVYTDQETFVDSTIKKTPTFFKHWLILDCFIFPQFNTTLDNCVNFSPVF